MKNLQLLMSEKHFQLIFIVTGFLFQLGNSEMKATHLANNITQPIQKKSAPTSELIISTTTTGGPKSASNSSTLLAQFAIPTEAPKAKRAELNASRSEFVVPNALRVNSNGGIQMLYNQEKTNTKVENIEETVTYQVKRQSRDAFPGSFFALKSPWGEKDGDQSRIVGDENLLTTKKLNEMNSTILQLEKKIDSLIEHISVLENDQKSRSESTNSTTDEFKVQLHELNKTLDSQSRWSQEIQKNISVLKDRTEGQIQTLSMHLRHMQNQTLDQILQGTNKLDQVLSTVYNTTQEIRLNEVRTRYNQKALVALNRTAQLNTEKIAELSTSSEAGARWTEQTTGCGGILVAEEGIVSYKFRQPYLNNERCIWTLRANRRSRIVLQLLEDGFQNSSNSDFITVTEFVDEQPSSLVTSTRIEHGNRAIHTFRGPLVFLTFYSDGAIPGNGFTLKFKGAGNASAADVPNAIRYRHTSLKEPVGHITYPEDKGVLYQPNEITSFTINPLSTATKVYLRYTDLEKEENCEYDSVSFYGSVMASFALAKKYCEQQEVYTGEFLQSSDGTFIVVFRTDGSTQFKGFKFSWETL